MRERLRFLYGPGAGDRAFDELEQTLERFRARLPAQPGGGLRFDQRDVVLTIRALGRPNSYTIELRGQRRQT